MAQCAACQLPLTIDVEQDDQSDDEQLREASSSTETTQTVPDDVELGCGCHFHWQCLLDSYQITECPRCKRNISTVDPSGDLRVLCNLNNEGGLQEGLDIFQLLAEESYLKAYPEERKCRAYLEFCKEGDVDAIVDLLDDNEEEEAEMAGAALPSKEILRYQDAMGSMYTGLHVAVIHGQVDVVWLLLFLASDLHVEQFPAEVFRAAERLGVSRENQRGHADIRALKDASGKTAEQLAAGMGDLWQSWLESGRLLASEQC